MPVDHGQEHHELNRTGSKVPERESGVICRRQNGCHFVDVVDLSYALVGVVALSAGFLPRSLASRPLSLPIVFLGLGIVMFLLPIGLPDPDPLQYTDLAVRLTELGVIVALMGAGLKLDRRIGWRAWSSTWRLLAVAMPLTIAGTALLGWWWLGLAPASAVLLGSALAPTEPVLASDVQAGKLASTSTRTAKTRCGSR